MSTKEVRERWRQYTTVEDAVCELACGLRGALLSLRWDNAGNIRPLEVPLKIPGLSKKTSDWNSLKIRVRDEFKIRNRNGEDFLNTIISGAGCSIETPTLKVHTKSNDWVTLSELDANGIWNKTIYTKEGKQTGSLDPSKPFEPIAKDDGHIVANKIWKNIFEETLPRIPFKDKSIVPCFEKAAYEFMQGVSSSAELSKKIQRPQTTR